MSDTLVNKGTATRRDSFSELFRQLANNSAAVVRDEIELLFQGFREKLTAVRNGIVQIVTGAFIIFAAFMCLCAASIIGLTHYMAPVMAALVIGAALALIGVIFTFIGYRHVRKSIFTP